MLANLLVQATQRLKHAVVQIASKHKRQHRVAQLKRVGFGAEGGYDAAFEPRKAFPLAPLHQEILFQRLARHHAWARIAVGAQGQVHAKHKAVVGGVANQGVNQFDGFGKVVVVADASTTIGQAGGLAVFVVHINQVDVARYIQLARAKFAHANDPQYRALAAGGGGHAVTGIELRLGFVVGHIQGELTQLGHGAGDHL